MVIASLGIFLGGCYYIYMRNITVCLFLLLSMLMVSCATGWKRPDAGRMAICQSSDFDYYLAPGTERAVRVGMHSTGVMKQRLCIRQKRVLVGPSGSLDGCEAEHMGVHYRLAFDSGGRLCHISSRSKGLVLKGATGPGSTLEQIRRAYGGYSLLLMPGYGRMVMVRGGDVFGFDWDGSDMVADDERAVWVELTRIPSTE